MRTRFSGFVYVSMCLSGSWRTHICWTIESGHWSVVWSFVRCFDRSSTVFVVFFSDISNRVFGKTHLLTSSTIMPFASTGPVSLDRNYKIHMKWSNDRYWTFGCVPTCFFLSPHYGWSARMEIAKGQLWITLNEMHAQPEKRFARVNLRNLSLKDDQWN